MDDFNEVTVNQIAAVFDTPELAAEDRIELFKYLEGVRKQARNNAAQKMSKRIPMIGYVAKHIVSADLFLRLFCQSFGIRRFVDSIRYKRAIKRNI